MRLQMKEYWNTYNANANINQYQQFIINQRFGTLLLDVEATTYV